MASGDVSADGYQHAGFFEYVKESFTQWSAPVLVIPGNHDVGDKAGEANTVRPNTWLGDRPFSAPTGSA